MAEMKHYTLGEYVKLLEEKGMLAEYNLREKTEKKLNFLLMIPEKLHRERSLSVRVLHLRQNT